MKTTLNLSLVNLSLAIASVLSQPSKLPDVALYNLDGKEISAGSITNDGMPMIMTFWKSNDNNCCDQLVQLNNIYEEVLKQQGIRMVAICVDCKGSIQHVKPIVSGRCISVDVFVDKNGDFKRAMGVSDLPFTILFDQNMRHYCEQAGYCANIEDMVCKKIADCLNAMNKKK